MGLSEPRAPWSPRSIPAALPTSQAEPGDVILRRPRSAKCAPRIVAETAIGKKASVEVWRDGKRATIEVAVGELPEEPEEVASKTPDKPQSQAQGQVVPGTGMTVSPLSPALRERFGLEEDAAGLVITDVKDGPAAEKGMKPGDVIIEAGNKPVRAPADLIKAVEAAKASSQKFLLLRVENPQALRYVALPLAEGKKR